MKARLRSAMEEGRGPLAAQDRFYVRNISSLIDAHKVTNNLGVRRRERRTLPLLLVNSVVFSGFGFFPFLAAGLRGSTAVYQSGVQWFDSRPSFQKSLSTKWN